MAQTVKCPKCGAEMNMYSRQCPVCGKRRLTRKDRTEIMLLILLLAFGYIFISSMRRTAARMDQGVMEGGCCYSVIAGAHVQENTWII